MLKPRTRVTRLMLRALRCVMKRAPTWPKTPNARVPISAMVAAMAALLNGGC